MIRSVLRISGNTIHYFPCSNPHNLTQRKRIHISNTVRWPTLTHQNQIRPLITIRIPLLPRVCLRYASSISNTQPSLKDKLIPKEGDIVIVKSAMSELKNNLMMITEIPYPRSRFQTYMGVDPNGYIRFFPPSFIQLLMPKNVYSQDLDKIPRNILTVPLPSWLPSSDFEILKSKNFHLDGFHLMRYLAELETQFKKQHLHTHALATHIWKHCQAEGLNIISAEEASELIHFQSEISPLPRFHPLSMAFTVLKSNPIHFDPTIPYDRCNPSFLVSDTETRLLRKDSLQHERQLSFAKLCVNSSNNHQLFSNWKDREKELALIVHESITRTPTPTPSFSNIFVLELHSIFKKHYPGLLNANPHIAAVQLLTKIGIYSPSENIPFLRCQNVHPWFQTYPENRNATLYEKAFQAESQKLINLCSSALNDFKVEVNDDRNSTSNVEDLQEMNSLISQLKQHWLTNFGLKCEEGNALKDHRRLLPRRKDFGDMPVFVIDDEGAHELDDGISIEFPHSSNDGDELPWIHVHVADPTTYVSPHSVWTMLAQLRSTSIYLPERHYPMVPDLLTGKIMGLGTSRYAMTFSFRLDSNGLVKEWDVNPSIVKNIVVLSYNQVDRLMDWSKIYDPEESPETRSYWLNHKLKEFSDFQKQAPSKKIQTYLLKYGAHLRSLQECTTFLRQQRLDRGWFEFDKPDVAPSISPYPVTQKPSFDVGPCKGTAPKITLKAGQSTTLSPARNVIAELMIMAGRVAARYCHDRQIPVPFRVQSPLLDQSESSNEIQSRMKALENRRNPVTGLVSFSYEDWVGLFQPATYSVVPSQHFGLRFYGFVDAKQDQPLGLEAYVQVTSPLRRFLDMAVHWQIKAYWLHDLDNGAMESSNKLESHSENTVSFPFTSNQIQKIADYQHQMEKSARRVSINAEPFWLHEFANRKELAIERSNSLKKNLTASKHQEKPKSININTLVNAKALSSLSDDKDPSQQVFFRSALKDEVRSKVSSWERIRKTQKVYKVRVIGIWSIHDFINRSNPSYRIIGQINENGLDYPRLVPKQHHSGKKGLDPVSSKTKTNWYIDGTPSHVRFHVVVEELGHFVTYCDAYDSHNLPELDSFIDAVFTRIQPCFKSSLMAQCPPFSKSSSGMNPTVIHRLKGIKQKKRIKHVL